MPTAERIAVYLKYNVDPEFLVPLYAEMCTRQSILSIEEATLLGLPTAIIIFRLREELRNPPSRAALSLLSVNVDQAEVWRRIAEAFQFPPEAANGPGACGNLSHFIGHSELTGLHLLIVSPAASPSRTTANSNGRANNRYGKNRS